MSPSPHGASQSTGLRETVLDQLWFDVDAAGHVLTCGPAAEEAGIGHGMDALAAVRVLAGMAGSVNFEPVDAREGPIAGTWRCRAPRATSTHDAALQLAPVLGWLAVMLCTGRA